MQSEELLTLVNHIQTQKCQSQTIEAKAAHKGCPTRQFDTLSGFSNQDDGGIIVFGLDENAKFEAVGVYDPQDLQKKVTEQCKQMETAVWPLFTVCSHPEMTFLHLLIYSFFIKAYPVLLPPPGNLYSIFLSIKSLISLSAVSCEHFPIFAHLELVSFPSNPSNNLFNIFFCLLFDFYLLYISHNMLT